MIDPPRPAGSARPAEARTPLPTVEAHRLARRFGDHEVIRCLDLTVGPGERVALRGPNGSGKSTVLRCLAGTLEPSEGWVRIGGEPSRSVPARRLVGVSFSQERSFYLRLSGYANLVFFARLRGYSRGAAEGAVRDITRELELEEIAAERTDRCSTGMVQQLSFARALLGEPSLLLLDEPTRSLDPDAVGRLWGALDARPQASVVMATHHQDDVDRCGRSLLLPT